MKISSENILFYGIVGSYSQRISTWPLIEALSDKGHNVTYISAYDSKDPHPKIYDYAPKKWKETMGPWEGYKTFYEVRKNKQMLNMWFELPSLGLLACESLYSDPEFMKWVKSSSFDLIVVDGLMNECAYGLVQLYKSKLIIYGSSSVMGWYYAYGLPDETASVTECMFNFPPGKEMSFLQRFVNGMSPLVWQVLREYWYFPKLEEVTKKALDLDVLPPFSEIERGANLLMLTSHYSLDYARSLPPHVVNVGGMTSLRKAEPVSKKLEDFINKGKNGFIYVSFGTVAEFVNFDKHVQEEFIKAIQSFPNMQFIWKSTYDVNATLPSHVMVTNWAPQLSLLAHPKIKAFITHSGMGSTVEAIHFEVPLISFPVLAEQDFNANTVASRNAGIKLEILTLKQEELEHAISEILENPKYRNAMKKLSKISKDRPTSALENAVWWTEYILRHPDSNEYLHPPSIQQSWWVKRQIDVWFFAAMLVILLPSLLIYGLFRLCRKLVYSIVSISRKNTNYRKKTQ
ncbi:2-hydroxyacylsphingosine 1-beta-galactosyltransferase [Orchesella cincta]|uniref:UDP-glucuronosyltransferase n=1 Tax=Orchesella cincta TaxID=48709 RepID=A0A1D2NER2_ORCCI|nr:2-hydroxyacylsphingosine 1-beta-galactosyltransferase [Orchesella cincta]